MTDIPSKTALVLSGGGARAAYQVGVLKAVAELLPENRAVPFPIICGTSAGAINATVLACYASRFKIGIRRLEQVWSHFHTGQIYRADFLGMTMHSLRWFGAMFRGRNRPQAPLSLLDNTPLRELLSHLVPFADIATAINKGDLYALSVTCSGYNSGESVSFFEGNPEIDTWHRYRRAGARARINLDHLMASSAIPLVFPAVKVNREYFGDGMVRFLAPISPALHMGATRVMIIGVDAVQDSHDKQRKQPARSPTIAEISGHVLDSVFIDSLDSDLERLQRINKTLSKIPPQVAKEQGITLRPIETLVINPSEDLAVLAGKHAHSLPKTVRFFFRRVGITRQSGSAILSYLLFESAYTDELVALGHSDAMRQKEEILRFFHPATETLA